MKLNPSKCAFGVSSEKFLGFMVSQRGIKANPKKVQAILIAIANTAKYKYKLSPSLDGLKRGGLLR